MRTAIDSSDPADGDALTSRVRSIRRRPWRKVPDAPLQEVVERKLARRSRLQDGE